MNYLAIIVAAISNLVLGFLFYSQWLFGNAWAKALGMTQEELKSPPVYVIAIGLISVFIEAYVIAWCIKAMNIDSVAGALNVGFMLWLGLVVVSSLAWFIWDKGTTLFWLNNAYQLIGILVMAMIISLWK
jgi:hypothetical protein